MWLIFVDAGETVAEQGALDVMALWPGRMASMFMAASASYTARLRLSALPAMRDALGFKLGLVAGRPCRRATELRIPACAPASESCSMATS